MGKGLNIVYWNVRSLISKIDSIRLEIHDMHPDIISICETWLHNNIDDSEVNIDGYNMTCMDRKTNIDGTIKRGGGLCIYVKHGIAFENLDNIQHCTNDIELSCIKLNLKFTRDMSHRYI